MSDPARTSQSAFAAECRAILSQHGIVGADANRLLEIHDTMTDENDADTAPHDWTLSADTYADFLECWQIGHRQMKRWIIEKRAGEAVRLTRAGAELFAAMEDLLKMSSFDPIGWQPITTAPQTGEVVWTYTSAAHGLPAFQGPCAHHPDAGWCTDELREVTHWVPLSRVALPPPISAMNAEEWRAARAELLRRK